MDILGFAERILQPLPPKILFNNENQNAWSIHLVTEGLALSFHVSGAKWRLNMSKTLWRIRS
jgi:hypothetical protein